MLYINHAIIGEQTLPIFMIALYIEFTLSIFINALNFAKIMCFEMRDVGLCQVQANFWRFRGNKELHNLLITDDYRPKRPRSVAVRPLLPRNVYIKTTSLSLSFSRARMLCVIPIRLPFLATLILETRARLKFFSVFIVP